jgi:hypothetical protein
VLLQQFAVAAKLPLIKAAQYFGGVVMKTKLEIFGGLLLLFTVPMLIGQEPSQRPPEDQLAASPGLVAWSYMQQPKPVPQPLPPPDKGVPQPDQSNGQAETAQAPDQVSTQTFTGKIVKDGGSYVLKVSSSTTYQLDQPGTAEKFENMDVKVVGTLDPAGKTIHVAKIELLT